MVAASGSTKPRIAVAVGAAAVVGQVAPVVVVPATVAVAAAATDLAAPAADRVVPDPVVRGAIIVVPPVADPRS